MENKILNIIQRNLNSADFLYDYERYSFQKVLDCRTDKVPHLYSRCDSCGSMHPVYKSCRNRMCPVCNGASSVQWVAKRENELLKTGYFLATYTVPKELRDLFLQNKQICYSLLFKAVSRSLLQGIQKGHKDFHGLAGFFAMLHTWDQKLNFHPHIHVVIPGGCLNEDKSGWVSSPSTFLLPVKRMSRDFRDKLISLLKKEAVKGSLSIPKETDLLPLLSILKLREWVVNVQVPGKDRNNPAFMIRYLSRYVRKTAVSEKRILEVKNENVYLSWFDRKQKKRKTEIISEKLFFKRLCFHILPSGFKKVRFYGFMANRYRKQYLNLCRFLMGIPVGSLKEKAVVEDTVVLFKKYFGVDISLCGDCGKGHISFVRFRGKGG